MGKKKKTGKKKKKAKQGQREPTFALIDGNDGMYTVHIMHWWPGRKYVSGTEVPRPMKSLIRRAKRSGSLYLTYAWALTPNGTIDGRARCMAIDNDKLRKGYGVDHAVGLLTQKALHYGYVLRTSK